MLLMYLLELGLSRVHWVCQLNSPLEERAPALVF
jgi:hypothetical protein